MIAFFGVLLFYFAFRKLYWASKIKCLLLRMKDTWIEKKSDNKNTNNNNNNNKTATITNYGNGLWDWCETRSAIQQIYDFKSERNKAAATSAEFVWKLFRPMCTFSKKHGILKHSSVVLVYYKICASLGCNIPLCASVCVWWDCIVLWTCFFLYIVFVIFFFYPFAFCLFCFWLVDSPLASRNDWSPVKVAKCRLKKLHINPSNVWNEAVMNIKHK